LFVSHIFRKSERNKYLGLKSLSILLIIMSLVNKWLRYLEGENREIYDLTEIGPKPREIHLEHDMIRKYLPYRRGMKISEKMDLGTTNLKNVVIRAERFIYYIDIEGNMDVISSGKRLRNEEKENIHKEAADIGFVSVNFLY